MNEDNLQTQIAKACLTAYDNLGKKGKPLKNKEWTTMAAFVQTVNQKDVKIIAVATGTKCIGQKNRSSNGHVVNDSHAEVLARRLLLKYFYFNLLNDNESYKTNCIFSRNADGGYHLKDGIEFHLFTTETPCGDAAIFFDHNSSRAPLTLIRKRKHSSSDGTSNTKKQFKQGSLLHESSDISMSIKIDKNRDNGTLGNPGSYKEEKNSNSKLKETQKNQISVSTDLVPILHKDIHRTGAKCVPQGERDLLQPGILYHHVGVLRSKPGRGDRTLSMSCSDKIMKWCVLGLQGGLLYNFLKEPIYLTSLVVNNTLFNRVSLLRALSLRNRPTTSLRIQQPYIYQTVLEFTDGQRKKEEKIQSESKEKVPSAQALLWCQPCKIQEVLVNGQKQGVTKKDYKTARGRSSVSKSSLFDDFKKLNHKIRERADRTYYAEKRLSVEYDQRRSEFFNVFFDWLEKPESQEEFT